MGGSEIWRSEVVLYGFMILNVLAVATGLLWAVRRGHLSGLDETMEEALQLGGEGARKETSHG